ncbi:T9SS sorting signal type C domain-containing protein [Flavobacterium cellulosilyticum]|uniref:T9SS type A sorting domain-containing protein n=1 Tax=Flavobacterium cellulosilyticum TaxID=2541731 RepID=A0A4R5C6D0_9FLAO|nr:T9SS sorting signal type C domain-containing protein [Flavobacterium cellulosilyticum]TDD94096.1 T9SS type A sorting domain-containing protein [Flavobacterium cellulosilyticum]
MTKITHDFYQTKSKITFSRMVSLFLLLFIGTQLSWGQQVIDFGGYQLPAPYTNVYVDDAALQLALFGTATVVVAPTSTFPPNPFTIGPAPYNLTYTANGTTDARLYRSNPNLSGYSNLTNVVQNPSLTDYDAVGTSSTAKNGRIQPNGSTSNGTNRFWSLNIPAGETVTFIIMSDGAAPTISLSVDGAAATTDTPVNFKSLVPTAYKITNATGTSHAYKFYSPNGKMSLFRVYFGDVSGVISPFWYNGQWENGAPTATKEAFIGVGSSTAPVNPVPIFSTATNGTFTAKKLTVNIGNTLTVNSGTNVTVQNEVINVGTGTTVVENNANLIQVNNTTNTGNIVVNRNSNPLSRLDYTMWASPVASQKLSTFSPMTSQSPSRFYTYDSAANLYSAVASPTTTNFAAGTGYLIRMPNTAAVSPAIETFTGVFTGVPNNGNVSLTGLTSSLYYSVGNPYPSALSATAFLSGNPSANGTLYFWRKTNNPANSSYATWTTAGGVANSGGGSAIVPNGTIQVGQGFIINTGTATALNFTNAMREVSPTSTQFLKTKQVTAKNRVWLNLTNTEGVFSQALVGYMEDATQGVDTGIDGKYINDSKVALTSNINNEEYTIQGRALPFDPSDVVALNFKTDVAGDYSIAIDHTDGLFATGQDVYLTDSTTGTQTNLKLDSYTFTAPEGSSNARFSLSYQKTLKVNAPSFNENSVTVYKNNGTLYVNSGSVAIANIKVYDIQGKLMAEQKNVKANTATIKDFKATQQVLIVKITSQDNTVVSKKVVN